MRIHIWPSEHWVDDAAWAAIVEVANEAERDVRAHLPALVDDLYLLVNQTNIVIPETGDCGFTFGPHCIRWDVDPARGIADVARQHLRRTLFHECHHAVRLQRRPEEFEITDWLTVVVFEGLASAFEAEAEAGDTRLVYQEYDEAVIGDWADELFRQPMDRNWPHWKFEHPDGRRNIAYRVGIWISDRATQRSGRTAADLVWEAPAEVLALAGI